ncbi:MAG: hypothetical protein K5979_03965 [Ruminococcus sp.]|nr:hypothetical protein [Ruminococcus sp.]
MASKVTEKTFTVWGNKGIERCACGNAEQFLAYMREYDDGSIAHDIVCEKCRRKATAAGDISEAKQAFNEMNRGAIPIRFTVESVPDIITIYSKSEDDVAGLLEKELSANVYLRRFTEADFRVMIHQQKITQDADIVVNGYAFKRNGEVVDVIDIKRIGPMTEIDPWMEMLLDGTILSRSQNMIDYNTPQQIWKQIRKIDLGIA